MTVNSPPKIKDEEVPEGSQHVYCEKHECWFVSDMYGQFICIVCLVEDRLDL